MTRTVTPERELKFLVPPGFVVPTLIGEGGPAVGVTGEKRMTLVAVYYDTADLRLARQGITLRRRSGGDDDGWHLKLPSGGALHDRNEIVSTSRRDTIPEELAELITVHRRRSTLVAAATLRTERHSRTLLDGSGQPLADIVDDSVVVDSANRLTPPFREVEVEDRGGGEEFLRHVAARLNAAGAGPADFLPKLVRALGPGAVAPAEPGAVRSVKRRSPAGLVVETLLRTEVRTVLELEPHLRLGDACALDGLLHSLGRLRTGLRLLRPLVQDAWAEETRQELGWLLGELEPSDAALAAQRLFTSCQTLPPGLALGTIHAVLSRRGAHASARRQARAVTALRDQRWPTLLDRLVIACGSPPTTPPAQRLCRDVLPGLIAHCWQDLFSRGGRLERPGPRAEEYRRILRSAGRLQVALTLCAPVVGKPGRRLARSVARLESALEQRSAAALTCAETVELASTPRLGAAGFSLGVLYEREQHAVHVAARDCRKAWTNLVAEYGELRISGR